MMGPFLPNFTLFIPHLSFSTLMHSYIHTWIQPICSLYTNRYNL